MNASENPSSQQAPLSLGADPQDDYAAIKAALENALKQVEELEQRDQYDERWWLKKRQALYAAFRANPHQGLDEWRKTYVDALIAWELDVCIQLTDEPFPFPSEAADLPAHFRWITQGIKEENYQHALDVLTYLTDAVSATTDQPLLDQVSQAILLIFMGRIFLYQAGESDAMPQLWEQARQHFEQARALVPQDGRPYAALAEYHRLQGDREEALPLCVQAVELSPDQPDGHIIQGLMFEDDKSWDKADDHYQKAINSLGHKLDVRAISRVLDRLLAPVSGNVYLQLARMLKEGRLEEAYKAVWRALSIGTSRTIRLRIKHQEDYVERTGWVLFGEILETLQRPSDAALAYYESAQRSMQQDEYQVAVDLFARANSLDLTNAPIYWYWADALRVLSASHQGSAREDLLTRALDIWDRGYLIDAPSIEFAWAYLTRAEILASLSELRPDSSATYWWEASVNLEQALLLTPGEPSVWLRFATVQDSLFNYAMALRAVEKALRLGVDSEKALLLDRDFLDALWVRASILATVDDESAGEAIHRLREESDTLDSQARVVYSQVVDLLEALLLYRQEQYARAISLLDRALERTPGGLWLRVLRAHAHRDAGNREAAFQDFTQVWEDTAPGGPSEHRSNLETRAGVGNELGYYAEAAEIFEELLHSDLANPFEVRMGLAYSYTGLSQTEKADRYFNEALVHLRHQHSVQSWLRDLSNLELRLTPLEGAAMQETVARYKEILDDKGRDLLRISEPARAELELQYVLDVRQPEPGSVPWLSAQAGLARMDYEAERWEQASAKYAEILETDSGRAPSRFPEARLALLHVARAEAQLGFAASSQADPSGTLQHFRRSLALRAQAGSPGTARDLLNDVLGLIDSDQQREILEEALQALTGAPTPTDAPTS